MINGRSWRELRQECREIHENTSCVDIKGYEGLYQITGAGEVLNIRQAHKGLGYVRAVKQRIRKDGYVVVDLRKDKKVRTHYVHRLVADAYLPNPDNKPTVNHKNGDKSKNRIFNLEWATYSENKFHASRVLGQCRGEQHYNSKLTEEQVAFIKENSTLNNVILAKMFGVDSSTISKIKHNKKWRHVECAIQENALTRSIGGIVN